MQFGVDEAGKGPVLGSMFAAAVVADPGALPSSIADSKSLSPERRQQLAAQLEADPAVRIGVGEIPVARIDEPETDMNTLTVEAHVAALAEVADVAEDGLTGYVDAGDTDAGRFGDRLAARLPQDLEIHAEHGADATYPIVGAASVVAKVRRDAHVGELAETYDADLGSGYPSDPDTRAFLSAHLEATGELPACARRSWQTSRDALQAAEQADLSEF